MTTTTPPPIEQTPDPGDRHDLQQGLPPTLTEPTTATGTAAGRLAWVVAASVATGLIGALILTLVVFAGAREHVITGSALLAFALGWALLAVLSIRLTSQPQRWALVPAVSMAVVAAYLLVFAPGDHTLRTLGWLWPPLVLALAAWMTVTARRQLRTRTRAWLLYPIFAFLAIGAVGGGYESVRLSLDSNAYPMPGQSYNVGGHRLHLHCTGSGGPTVVLENGSGETSPAWDWIAPAVARDTHVCAYDRAGQGWSQDASSPQDGQQIAADLHTLLGLAHEAGPYVLVGHSTGGTYAMTYAARYPTEVAGMVLLDSASPQQFTILPNYSSFYSTWRRVSAVLPSLARLGGSQLAKVAFPVGPLPGHARAEAQAFATSPRNLRSQRDEWSKLPAAFTQAQQLTTLDGKPLVVITASEQQQAGWNGAQDRLAALSTNSVHRLVHATHEALLEDKNNSTDERIKCSAA